MTTPNQNLTRDSVVTHLESFKSFGLHHILPLGSEGHEKEKGATIDPCQCLALDELCNALQGCQRCVLCKGRTNLVFGQGNPRATLMFVGEGPGADEDEQGLAFVGAAGQLLTKIIEAMKLTRQDVYIANVVKCRPPGNRNPMEDEINACLPFLKKQIELVRPRIIMCLGKIAAQTLLETQIPISKMRGTFREMNGIAVMPSFHPAYLLRNPSAKRLMWDDCKQVMKKIQEIGVPGS